MNARDPSTENQVIRLAFLGAWQAHRACSWKAVVSERTPHVLPSRAGRSGRRVLRRELRSAQGPVEIRLAGYSWGAWTAIHLVQQLLLDPQRFDPRLAQDPWTIRMALLDPVDSFRRSVVLPDDERLQCWNVYQRNGCFLGCPGSSDWYRGRPVVGAHNLEITEEGRSHPEQDGVPPERAPDHIQLGYRGWNGWDARVASVLAGGQPF